MFRSRSPHLDVKFCFGLWGLRSVRRSTPKDNKSKASRKLSTQKPANLPNQNPTWRNIGAASPSSLSPAARTLPSMIFFLRATKRGRERHAKFSLALSNLRFRSERMEKSVAKDDGNVTHRAPSRTHSLLRDILNSIWKNYKIKLTWLCVLPFSRSGADSLSISLAAAAEKANKGARRKKITENVFW